VRAGGCRSGVMTDLHHDLWAPPVAGTPAGLSPWASTATTLQERMLASDLAEAAERSRDARWCALFAALVMLGFVVALFLTAVNYWILGSGALLSTWFWVGAAGNARDARHARRGW
jgi:hypothetical protein